MKNKLLAGVIALTMVLGMAGCGNGGAAAGKTDTAADSAAMAAASAAESAGEMQTVGFVSAAWSDDYCKRLNDALVELGPEYNLKVDAVNGAPSGTPDVNGYIEAIDALASKNLDAMIVQPLFSVPDHCVQFNKKGVPLTFLNIAPEISDNCKDLEYYYAGCFDTNIGSQLAEEMAKGLKDGAKICMLCLTYGQTNAEQRREGFENREVNPNDILNKFAVTKLKNINSLNDDSKNCIICLEDFKKNDKVIYLPCIHFFHEMCIKNWIKEKQFCPVCKLEINNNLNN